MFGKLNNTEIDQLLRSQLIGRIGCHANGLTYVVPVSYVYDADTDCIYVHAYDGKKMEMMRTNPKVCFQADDTRELAYWQSVICWGDFEELTDEADKKNALLKLNNRKFPPLSSQTMQITKEWPFTPEKDNNLAGLFFRIRFTDKTGRYEKIAGQEFFAT